MDNGYIATFTFIILYNAASIKHFPLSTKFKFLFVFHAVINLFLSVFYTSYVSVYYDLKNKYVTE